MERPYEQVCIARLAHTCSCAVLSSWVAYIVPATFHQSDRFGDLGSAARGVGRRLRRQHPLCRCCGEQTDMQTAFACNVASQLRLARIDRQLSGGWSLRMGCTRATRVGVPA